MVKITVELLRKRAEHNNGLLSDLQEIALHGQNIEKIELVGQAFRQLKILYLQNNVIGHIENLHHLKELKYLNLALNNITHIENLHRCESLCKLDLTMNFIPTANLSSLENLAPLYNLRELHLLGNPCTQWEWYRDYVSAKLTQLTQLDGKAIRAEDREHALAKLHELENKLQQEAASSAQNTIETHISGQAEGNEDGKRPWCPEVRLLEHREQERLNQEAEKRKEEDRNRLLLGPSKRLPFRTEFPPLPEAGEQIVQRNEGKWAFSLRDSEDDTSTVLDLVLGNGVATSDIKADVQPHVVRLLIKGKLVQLALMEEVDPSKSHVQRSKATGNLVVTMPKPDALQRQQRQRQLEEAAAALERRASEAEDAGRDGGCKIQLCWQDDNDLPPL